MTEEFLKEFMLMDGTKHNLNLSLFLLFTLWYIESLKYPRKLFNTLYAGDSSEMSRNLFVQKLSESYLQVQIHKTLRFFLYKISCTSFNFRYRSKRKHNFIVIAQNILITLNNTFQMFIKVISGCFFNFVINVK